MKRDIQGKFALKSDDYRAVRSVRLTDSTWQALGIAAECLGMTRADYLEQLVRENLLPSITPEFQLNLPCNHRQDSLNLPSITREEQPSSRLLVADLEVLREQILLNLKLGQQASGYKAAKKALNQFIAKLAQFT
ncbi:MAG: hypothetical protein WBB28_09330 [Crinalium sp.]